MTVVGNRAWVSGIVTDGFVRDLFPGNPDIVGHRVLTIYEDNGNGAGADRKTFDRFDLTGRPLLTECLTADPREINLTGLFPIPAGNITIDPN